MKSQNILLICHGYEQLYSTYKLQNRYYGYVVLQDKLTKDLNYIFYTSPNITASLIVSGLFSSGLENMYLYGFKFSEDNKFERLSVAPITIQLKYSSAENVYTVYNVENSVLSRSILSFSESFSNINPLTSQIDSNINIFERFDILYSTYDIYVNMDTRAFNEMPVLSKSDMTLIYSNHENVEPDLNFTKVFELNLFDKNFNDAKHTFTLKANKDDVRYNELMELIKNENNYCIYLTDYARLLTYEDNSFYSPLKSRFVFDVTVT